MVLPKKSMHKYIAYHKSTSVTQTRKHLSSCSDRNELINLLGIINFIAHDINYGIEWLKWPIFCYVVYETVVRTHEKKQDSVRRSGLFLWMARPSWDQGIHRLGEHQICMHERVTTIFRNYMWILKPWQSNIQLVDQCCASRRPGNHGGQDINRHNKYHIHMHQTRTTMFIKITCGHRNPDKAISSWVINTVSADGLATMGAGHQQAQWRSHSYGTTMSSRVHADTKKNDKTLSSLVISTVSADGLASMGTGHQQTQCRSHPYT